jgi:hypothetical protein
LLVCNANFSQHGENFFVLWIPCKLLHLLFGVLRIFGTLMEWNRRESHDCSELFWLGTARTDTWHCPFSRDWKWRRHILCIQCTLYRALFCIGYFEATRGYVIYSPRRAARRGG